MFELKTNEEIGAYLKELILSKYPSCRQFCIAYIDLTLDFSNDPQDLRSDEIRKLTNRLSQILKGKKSIQTYDLPIFSELLDVSCEQMLSAGAVCKPITNRRTNYNIAFSKDECDWIEYINREDCIASYADEFGKTVVDYAIEFKNYGFIRFLIEKGYITLISDDKGYVDFNFGASTSLKVRPYEARTFENELYDNKVLRTQIISLALENNDYRVLDEMRARDFPPQLTMTTCPSDNIKFSDYYDKKFYLIKLLLSSTRELNNAKSSTYQLRRQNKIYIVISVQAVSYYLVSKSLEDIMKKFIKTAIPTAIILCVALAFAGCEKPKTTYEKLCDNVSYMQTGYYIAEEYWGKGIMTKVIKEVCDYIFKKTDIIRIFAEPFAYNIASCRVLEKAGFELEGTLRNNAVKKNKILDMKMYAIVT